METGADLNLQCSHLQESLSVRGMIACTLVSRYWLVPLSLFCLWYDLQVNGVRECVVRVYMRMYVYSLWGSFRDWA